MHLKRTLGCLLPAALLAVGCGDDDGEMMTPDSGMTADGGTTPDGAAGDAPATPDTAAGTDMSMTDGAAGPDVAAAAPGLVDITPFTPPMPSMAPWNPAVWFRAEEASPLLYNRLAPLALDTTTGAATGATPFLGPADFFSFTPMKPWQGNPVPDSIVATKYLGAFEPGKEPWTMGWTVGIHGNKAVWDFANEAGTALAGKTAPAADGMCPTGTTLKGKFSTEYYPLMNDEAKLFAGAAAAGDYDICELAPQYTTPGTVTLTNDNIYWLPGGIGTVVGTGGDMDRMNDVGVTLVIEAGTLVIGKPGSSLVVTRGSKIMAVGTKANPIVFTSDKQIDQRFDGMAATDVDSGRKEWGGLVIIGNARDNRCRMAFDNCNSTIEGLPGIYGAGPNDADSSGELRYIVVRNGGSVTVPDQEINGLTFYATGHGTKAEYLQVHRNSDDGVEFFGATTSVAHLALTENSDDSFDWGHGFTGTAQFVFIRQAQDEGDRFIEADNDSMVPDSMPISFPQLANFTMIGPAAGFTIDREKAGGGLMLRRGTKVQLWNSLLMRAAKECVDIDDTGRTDTYKHVTNPKNPGTNLVIARSVLDCMKPFMLE